MPSNAGVRISVNPLVINRRALLVTCLAATLVACGKAQPINATPPTDRSTPSSPPAGASASPTSSASTAENGTLFVVEESHTKVGTVNLWGQPAPQGMQVNCYQRAIACAPPDTVAIVGLDGYARAKAHFTPLIPPFVWFGQIPEVAPQAYAADGRVFYIDGLGVVRSLALDGRITTVARFPLSGNQQQASFAVSPDGKHLLASIITLPPKPTTASATVAPGAGSDNWIEAEYAADSGGSVRLISQQAMGSQAHPLQLLQFVGWDTLGPLASYAVGPTWSDAATVGNLVRVDSLSGRVDGSRGLNSCAAGGWAVSSLPEGSYVCVGKAIQVFDSEGRELWQFTKAGWAVNAADGPASGPALAFLAPDKQHVVASGPIDPISDLIASNGRDIHLPQDLLVTGWVDSNHVIGWPAQGTSEEMQLLDISNPTSSVDLGFQGSFVGAFR